MDRREDWGWPCLTWCVLPKRTCRQSMKRVSGNTHSLLFSLLCFPSSFMSCIKVSDCWHKKRLAPCFCLKACCKLGNPHSSHSATIHRCPGPASFICVTGWSHPCLMYLFAVISVPFSYSFTLEPLQWNGDTGYPQPHPYCLSSSAWKLSAQFIFMSCKVHLA